MKTKKLKQNPVFTSIICEIKDVKKMTEVLIKSGWKYFKEGKPIKIGKIVYMIVWGYLKEKK